MSETKQTLDTGSVLDVPRTVRVCPYCGGDLCASFSCWMEDDDGTWKADGIELECKTEPEIDGDDWPEWNAIHSEMPYVHWLPATVAVEKWVNEKYRFNVTE